MKRQSEKCDVMFVVMHTVGPPLSRAFPRS